jgi:iron complex transport system permease protein
MRDIVITLFNGAIGRGDTSEFNQVIFGLRLPRIALGILVGAALSTSGRWISGVAAKSAGRSLRAGSFQRRGAGRNGQLDCCAARRGRDSTGGVHRRGSDDHRGLFSGTTRRQLDSATLLLAGIVAASFLSAIIMFPDDHLSKPRLRGMAFWLMGDLTSPPRHRFALAFYLVALLWRRGRFTPRLPI